MENNENLEDRIVDVAKDVFLENGFEMTSMSDIAAKVGINRPTLHYYFRTKERMFRAVLAPIFETFMPKVQTILAGDIPFIERLEKILDEYLIIFSENPFLPRFVLSEIQRNPDNLILMIHRFGIERMLQQLSEILDKEMDTGKIKRIPHIIILCTFYSQLTFPFLTRNMLMKVFSDDTARYKVFLEEWKQNILSQMRYLLCP
ncbi:MAG TPA: TetR/AcrR family transcriptional regulator [Porphyromonadaceae bacterium]|nr:uncharacterized protein BN496_00826 [Bacteroides sp. CAG:144]HCZ20390.1 TetR/AcrR family transcriptional regulator [Porphyromonadaceae bacterium]